MTVRRIVRLGADPPAAETGRPARVVAGDPLTTVRNYYADPTGRFFAGVWDSTPGKWQVDYAEEELCVLLAGVVRLTGADGTSETFRPGDAFVIPKGFAGTWETVEPVRKFYAIYEPGA